MRSKLTETTQATIRAALEAGNTRAAAAQAAGITSETLRLWMRKGEKQKTGRHKTLARTVEQAEAQAEIQAAWQRGEWRAAAWWLERRRLVTYREQKDQASSAAGEERSIRIIYEAKVAQWRKIFSSAYAALDAQNNGEQPKPLNRLESL